MNSLLQCLFNIEELRDYFIKELKEGKINKKQHPISYRFAKVMKDLMYSNKEYINPIKFKEIMGKNNPLFEKNKAADATDLLRFLIDSFISELKVDNIEEEEEEEGKSKLDNKNEILKNIEKEMKENFIYKYLSVFTLTTYICESKKHGKSFTYSYSNETAIIFNLEKIIKNNNSSQITLQECFKSIQKEIKDNEFSCCKCNNLSRGSSFEKILVSPKILIIILNRGKGKKITNNVVIDKVLDISDFIDENGKQKSNNIYYQLIGSCNHFGDSSPSGHYISTCLYKDKFYYFNDRNYEELKFYRCIGQSYILFYHRKEFKDYNDNPKPTIDYNEEKQQKLSQNEVEDCKKKLIEVFNMFKFDKNNFKIEYINSNVFKWRITEGKKKPLIMDFSNPPKNKIYNLMSIITIENKNSNDNAYFNNSQSHANMKINLNEKPYDIFSSIYLFLKDLFTNYNLTDSKCMNCNLM